MDLEIKQRLRRIAVYTLIVVAGVFSYIALADRLHELSSIAFAAFLGPFFWQILADIKGIRERRLSIEASHRTAVNSRSAAAHR